MHWSCRARRCWKPEWYWTDTRSSGKSTAAAGAISIWPSISADGALVAIKTPSIDLRADPAYLQRFMMEEWVARRINSAHVLKPRIQSRTRNYLYVVTEFVEGQTLTQWMIDNPKPSLETVRGIVEQIARGLQAFHRMEMLHQDLRPENIMIDGTGTAKIIDFGSTRIAGIAEDSPSGIDDDILGTVQYTAPEYFLGEGGSARSDIFSLGVIAYQMLTGRLPYGAQVRKSGRNRNRKSYGTNPPSTTIAISRHGLTERSRKPCIRTQTSATRNYPNLFSIFVIPTRQFLKTSPSPAHRTRPAAVLESSFGGALLFFLDLPGLLLLMPAGKH